MEQHVYLSIVFLASALLIGICIFIVYKKRTAKHMPDHERHLMELIIREQEKNKRLAQRLEALEEDLAKLKYEMNETVYKAVPEESKPNNSFQNNLQFHSFMQKNQELVLLLQNGLSIEKAAKVSNRSIREVEMVDAVLKQRSNL